MCHTEESFVQCYLRVNPNDDMISDKTRRRHLLLSLLQYHVPPAGGLRSQYTPWYEVYKCRAQVRSLQCVHSYLGILFSLTDMDVVRRSLVWSAFLLGLGSALPKQEVNGIFGESVTFDVSFPLPEEHRIMWNFGETGNVTVVMFASDGSDPLYNVQYRGRSSLLGDGTLRLDKLTYADEGCYGLYVYDDKAFTTIIVPYQLSVFAILRAPSFSVLSDLIVDGKNVTLHCDSGSQNVTTYTFYRGEKMICSEPHVTCRGAYLDLTPITESDSGSYTCSIQNPVSSSTSAPLSLTVSVPVSAVTLTSNKPDQLLWPGEDSVHLLCSSTGTDVTYSWSLDGAAIPEEPRYRLTPETSLLIISPVSAKDNGEFMCTARNWINSENSSRLNLKLAAPVSAVSLTSNTSGALWAGQDSVSLYCTAQGSDITFSWRLNGLPVSSNPPYYITGGESPPTSTLTISPIPKNHIGPFTCTATNRLNKETSPEINLNVNWYPEGNIECTAQGHGRGLHFSCSWPGGRPAANVTMIYNDVTETKHHEVTRHVSVWQIAHSSNLTCIGEYFGETFSCSLIFGFRVFSGFFGQVLRFLTLLSNDHKEICP
ncbi:pregnancy-specific beta-1-glycoprotein 8-like [Leptodactylus fuscus]|uniref:pregnancy-specific beta-1-glycoprotein 8-like n=1 Tax=Leptodactylus fuscus TaxID=238119 RepID=UPI003F4EA6C7